MSTEEPFRIILLLMVKNESRIIARSIQSALRIADAVCVSDTGSTDNTVLHVQELFKTLPIPGRTYDHPWTNFGINRSKSFNDAKQFCHELDWNPARTYVLALDADMELVIEPSFNKQTDLGDRGYSLIQKAGSLHYANCRLMRLDSPWSCIGATHEYWDGPMGPTIADSKIWINDRNDGGCKSDKFERDLKLLQKELEEQPKNVRTHFYLAQTYKCLGRREESIEIYKKRIELGGWFEEVWYSYYMIGQMYLEMNMAPEAEMWIQKGQTYNSYRAESLYLLVKHFRIVGHQWKAMHYYLEAKRIPKPAVALFLESEIYDHLLDYEYTVLQYYVNPERAEGLRASARYLLKDVPNELTESVFQNAEFYVQGLKEQASPLKNPAIEDYIPSSVAVTRHNGALVKNVRYVNYRVTPQGDYIPKSADNIVRTENMCDGQTAFVTSDLPTYPTNILGLEDIRLFSQGNCIRYTATSKSSAADTKYRITYGIYDVANNRLTESVVLQPPSPTECEKNWLMVPHETSPFIYKWHPFEAGNLKKTTLQINTRHRTPAYFHRLRGSANGVLYRGQILCLTHVVKYGSPRKYYHHLVKLDRSTLKPVDISVPFYFKTLGVEYCLGFDIQEDTITFFYSTFDSNPASITLPIRSFEFLGI
jgi:tetratricopeptide (TPR) repeat protein